MKKLYYFCNTPTTMMAKDWAESTWEIINYGRFINRFPPDIIKSVQQLERINKEYVDENVNNVQSNISQIKYIYIYIYIYIYTRECIYTRIIK